MSLRLVILGLAVTLVATVAGCADEGTPSTANPFPPRDLVATPDAPPAWLAVLSTGHEEEWPGTARPSSILKGSLRPLGSRDGWSYFVGLYRRGGLCLIAYRPRTEAAKETRYDSCGSLAGLDTQALGVIYLAESTKGAAYLLPDGYAEAARALGWAEVVHPNLLVVTDFASAPSRVTELRSSAPGGGTLRLDPAGR